MNSIRGCGMGLKMGGGSIWWSQAADFRQPPLMMILAPSIIRNHPAYVILGVKGMEMDSSVSH